MEEAATRKAEPMETMHDSADGLEWETPCKCDLVFAVPKKQLTRQRKAVTHKRRRQIAERVIRALGLAGL